MKPTLLAIAFLTLLLAPASAQDGGKLTWIGKGRDPIESIFEEARKQQQPMMLFFSSQGDAACKALCEGAFSHPDVVAAAAKVSCIYVECGEGKNARIVSKMAVTAFPAILFCDFEGTVLGSVPHRDGPALAAALQNLTERMQALPPFTENLDEALSTAKQKGLPLLVYFYDDSPACLTINRSLIDPELKPLQGRFSLARSPMKRGSTLCVRYGVDRAPTILILDPRLPKPEEKPLARIATSRNPRELRRDLEEALATSGSAAPAATPSTVPLPSPGTPKEELSDDQLDRKFIQARITVANGLIKQGKTKEAVKVLEDVVQSYPKHVATAEAAKLLEQLNKK
jgi:hypothetical protein